MTIEIDHIGLSVSDMAVAKAFYTAALAPLRMSLLMEFPASVTGNADVAGFGSDGKPFFWISVKARHRHTPMSRSAPKAAIRSMRSSRPRSPLAARTTAGRASANSIIRTTTARSCSIPTGITSKRYAMRRLDRRWSTKR